MSTTEMKQLPAVAMLPAGGLKITSFEELQRVGGMFFGAKLFGDNQEEQKVGIARCCIKIIAGAEIGLTPFFSMKNVYIINNQVTYSYQLVCTKIKQSGKYKFEIAIDKDGNFLRNDKSCTLHFFELEGGKWKKVDTVTYGEEDAKREGVFDKVTRDGRTFATGYQKHPTVMYFSRALTRGANMHFADLFGGSVYTPADFHVAEVEIDAAQSMVSSSEGVVVDAVADETTNGNELPKEPEVVETTEEERPGSEQIAQIFKHATASGWRKDKLEEWFEPFLESRGVDISTTEKLFETWTWKDVTSAIDYLTANKPEAK